MNIRIAYHFLPKQLTVKAVEVQQAFGVGFDQGEHVLVEGLKLDVKPGEIVLLTGDSGSGKSSIMREICRELAREAALIEDHTGVLQIEKLEVDDRILIDQLGLPLAEGMSLLSQCGLSEARLMLRMPRELSDGQRYRFLMALAISKKPRWVVADEFCANLDRTLAKVLAFNLHKLSKRLNVGFILATTHDDLLEDLAPDQHIRCRSGLQPVVEGKAIQEKLPDECKQHVVKKKSPSRTGCGSPQVPSPIGRISLGGITEVIMSGSPNSSLCCGMNQSD